MSLIKKIASVFGKKDEPKQQEAPKQKKPSRNKQQTQPGQEEWRPGQKKKPRPQQQRRKPKAEGQKSAPPRKKKPQTDPFALTEAEQARMKEFRPEEEDRRIAYERRLRKRKEEKIRSELPSYFKYTDSTVG